MTRSYFPKELWRFRMAPQERIMKKIDQLWDEYQSLHGNSRRKAEIAAELRGLAFAVVETTRMTVDDVRQLANERAEARRLGERQPALLTWLAHRDGPTSRISA